MIETLKKNYLLRASFFVALVATVGSLFFSDSLGYPPCVLCWYQRIFMYPLVVIFGSALWNAEENYLNYSLPLSLVGLMFAVYHNLLYYRFISDSIVPCERGISCTAKQIEIFGFLTVPLMSLASFLLINGFTIAALVFRKGEET